MESISLDIASSMGTRIRFVTCPTCRQILPELPEFALYKCGTCATILQAKNCHIGKSVSETNPMKKHGNSCRATGKGQGNDFVVDPCSTSENAHRNDKFSAEEDTKGNESMYLPRENNQKSPNEFPGQISESCAKTESAKAVFSITAVEGHKDGSSMMEQKNKVLDENNATHLEGSLNREDGNETKVALGTINRSILTESLPKDDKYLKVTQKKLHYFGPPGSEEILKSLPNNPRSPIGLISKSPTKVIYPCDARNFKGTGDRSANRPHIKDRLRFTKIREGNNDTDTRRMTFLARSSQLPHEHGFPSSIRRNVSQQYPKPHLPNSTSYDDSGKQELLKKVYELEDMINQTRISKQMSKGRSHSRVLGEKKPIPLYYDNVATVRNAYANVKYPGGYDNHSQGLQCTHQPKISKLGCSCDPIRCRNRMDCVCSRCCHQCWHHTTKSCSHCIFNQHAVHSGNNYDNGYPSHSPSPQTHSNDKFFSQVLEQKADNQLQKKKNVIKLCSREKHQAVRRHLRPVAGGAPIMACHYCSELLQLPAEHFLSNSRFYQLRCYSCGRIMKLSMEKKLHLVPYLPTISAPPPSEIDD